MSETEEKNDETTEPVEKTDATAQEGADLMSMLMAERPELRMTGIYGDVTESRCSEAIYGLLALSQKTDPAAEPDPIEFIVSTHGGSAAEMFGVYDIMRQTREETPIHTKGVGKVMSAGVLLLAAGTKGERRIGRFCRVMIHGVVAGQHGYIADVQNEFKETKYIQKMYVKALAAETNMSEAQIRRIMNKNKNFYLDAETAVKMGIADIIF